MRGAICAVVVFIVTGGCHSEVTGPIAVHGALTTIDVRGRCLVTCDPPSAGLTLALVTTVNERISPVYVEMRGSQPKYVEQELVRGDWGNAGPPAECAITPPQALSPGHSVQANWFFACGRRRIVVYIAQNADLSDRALDASAAVDFP